MCSFRFHLPLLLQYAAHILLKISNYLKHIYQYEDIATNINKLNITFSFIVVAMFVFSVIFKSNP